MVTPLRAANGTLRSDWPTSRVRYYDPRGGRFVSQDPIGTNGGVNLYGPPYWRRSGNRMADLASP